jgi:antitoxin ParD1/3/4
MNESVCETQPSEADARLEALLIEGLAAGEDIPLTPDFWSELKQDAAEILAGNQKGIPGV